MSARGRFIAADRALRVAGYAGDSASVRIHRAAVGSGWDFRRARPAAACEVEVPAGWPTRLLGAEGYRRRAFAVLRAEVRHINRDYRADLRARGWRVLP